VFIIESYLLYSSICFPDIANYIESNFLVKYILDAEGDYNNSLFIFSFCSYVFIFLSESSFSSTFLEGKLFVQFEF